jgi:hypothetical protein
MPNHSSPAVVKSNTTPAKQSMASSSSSSILPSGNQTSLPQPPKLSTMSTPPSVFSTPEPSQGLRMSLSALMDKAKNEPSVSQNKQTNVTKTPQMKSKVDTMSTSTTLPFGLSETKSTGAVTAASLSASSSSVLAMKKSGKLLKAAKTVQNMVKVTNVIATPRVPALSTAVEREDFDELLKRNDEYFARLLSSQAETFESLTDMVDALTKKLNESVKVRHSAYLS